MAQAVINQKILKDIIEVADCDIYTGCEFIECEFVGCGPAEFNNCIFSRCLGFKTIPNTKFDHCKSSP